MKDAGPSNSPASARGFGATDEQLSAELRKWTGATPALQPVGELLDRHWEAAFAYARLCTDGPRSAGMLTTAAFTRLFGETLRQNGPTSAWRPHLLITVRRIAAEWAGDHRCDTLHPDLLAGTGDGDRPASRLLPSPRRRLLSGAFQRLPQSARCLLWHVEVEAEPLTSPAGLLGLDEEGARVELGRARDRLREESLQLHRELAPDEQCRRYLRLLDVTYRRGGLDLDPDLRAHIEGCGHCSAAADQLDQFNHDLGVALSEAVLGWGGRDYAERRAHEAGESAGGGRHAGKPERPGTAAGAAAAVMPAGAARELFPDPVALAREVFPDPVDLAYEIIPDPVRPPRGTSGSARERRAAAPDPVRAPRETFPGWTGEGREAFSGPVGRAREDFPADPVRAPREAVPGPAREDFPGPVHTAREAFPGPVRQGREAFPDQVALAGAVGESFTDPGGPAAVPPPPPRPEGVAPAAGPAQAPARADVSVPPAPAPRAPRPEGSRAAARRSAQKAARRTARRRNLTAGVLTVSGLVVLPLVLWSTGNSGDGAPAGPERPTGEAPDSEAGEASRDPSWAGAGDAEKGALRGRLHNVSSGLCVGIDGKKAVEGAEAELATCSADAAQQWTYETDGLLRNGAAPDLCLDSRLGYSVRLAPCTGASRPDPKDIRYDFTLQGALVPRSDQDLALTPAATDGSGALVLKARADDEVQRWVIDTSRAKLQMESVNWNAAAPVPHPTPTPTPTPSKTPEPTPRPSATSPAPQPTTSSPAATESPCHSYGYYCDPDGRYGNPGYGYPGYGYGYGGYGYGGGGRR
ncbi:Ricin-type beta-trefoil lectin domain-containing protein [Streptomyces sp. Ag82_O1-12]|uniref:ricin-type beta-trefoil lectin domain protein n=1 Tax=unclassified Streptomyces TaxID=2593676 RepID=UPI000BCE6AC4|nr:MULTISPECIES: ricin-type beta-trefoil lectin domain protein [unclassified Streptomyces]SMQ21197.1 Ricin-type beta-trefoil lectin domain-containing protein [Streptomyces sp. Ag82_O1-12]SOD49783.1 Ricin-type beta-trefoil lectin domain-containing protein [Streptomyces sp. Ag82_G6-1]